MNDRIVIRVWNKRSIGADEFIGEIPEIPNDTKNCRVSKIHA